MAESTRRRTTDKAQAVVELVANWIRLPLYHQRNSRTTTTGIILPTTGFCKSVGIEIVINGKVCFGVFYADKTTAQDQRHEVISRES